MKMLKNEKGFTLIELVLVIVVLGVLAAVATIQFGTVIADSKNAAVEGAAGSVNAQLALAVNTLQALPTGGAAGTFNTQVYDLVTLTGSNMSMSAYDGILDRFAICTFSSALAGPCTITGTVLDPIADDCGATTDMFVQVSYVATTGALAISAPLACTS